MSKITSSIFITLDGFAASKDHNISWFPVNQEFFDYAGILTDNSDTAIYGRKTFEMMDQYWPTAAQEPDAGEHEIQHGNWYNAARKIVFSNSLSKDDRADLLILDNSSVKEIREIKKYNSKDMVIFGSPTIVNLLTNLDLIDEYYIFVAPIILGDGIPLFEKIQKTKNLELLESKQLETGVMMLHYKKIN